MIRYLFIPAWAALELAFVHLFLGSFLEEKREKNEIFWLLILGWILTAIYGLFEIHGIYGYLMYLLVSVFLLLSVYGEPGPRGLCLLCFLFLIPAITDLAVTRLAKPLTEPAHSFALTCGKGLPALLVLLLRRFHSLDPVNKAPQTDQDSLLLRQHMEMQQESMLALEQNYRIQRKSAHEFEHHMQVLRDLLARDEVDAAREYLRRLKKDRSLEVMHISACHPVIDVILNQKYQIARENEIKMQIQVNDLSALTIPVDSLAVVLTNLLDNAIEACRRIDGYREIFCCILDEDGLYISIRNTSEPVQIVGGKIPTSKEDSLSHGYGLMSVSHVLDKLNAEYTFGYADGWFHFAAEIEQP